MTLLDALLALHAAGRIRAPLLPGMRVGTLQYGHGRVLAVGLLVSVVWEFPIGPPQVPAAGLYPDPSDPATRGCLLELLRHVVGDPYAMTGHTTADGWWVVWHGAPEFVFGATEGEALVAALCALAGALPSPGVSEESAEPYARPTPRETP